MCAQGSILLQIPPAGGSELNEMQDRIDKKINADRMNYRGKKKKGKKKEKKNKGQISKTNKNTMFLIMRVMNKDRKQNYEVINNKIQ